MNKNIHFKNQNTHYKNLIFDDLSNLSFYTQDKQSYEYKQVLASDNKWGRAPQLIHIRNILNDNLNEVYDFCGGKHNEESYNFLIDLKNDCLIDNVRFISPKSYYPTVLNIYFGNDKEQVFDKTAVPVKEFKGFEEKGDYNYSFEPKFVRYIRIEVLDNINTYFAEMLVIPISFLGVFGYKNVYTEDFSKNIRNILANTKTKKYVTLLQPYLYRTDDGTWVNSFNKQTEQLNFNEIPSECLGESYIEVDFKTRKNSVNIGLTNDPSMIFDIPTGVNFSKYIDISLYINSPIGGSLTFCMVPVNEDCLDTSLNISYGWQKILLRTIMPEKNFLSFSSDDLEQNFKRLQIVPAKKMLEGSIIVGSIVAKRYIDWKSKGLNLIGTDDWSFDRWLDTISNLDLSDVDTTELDLFLNSYKEYSSICELKEERK